MKRFKSQAFVFGLFIFLITFIFAFSPKILGVGKTPINCLDLTNTNPKHTPYCNPSCTSSNCISYCKAYSGQVRIKAPFKLSNLQIKVKAPTHPIWVSVAQTSIQNQKVDCSNSVCTATLTDTSGHVFNKGDSIIISIRDKEGNAIGFRLPSDNNMCGENNICREDGGKNGNPRTYEQFSIADITTPDPDYKLIQKQCYGDSPIGDSDFDFNDYALVLFGKPVADIQDNPVCEKLSLDKNAVVVGTKLDFTCNVKQASLCAFSVDNKVINVQPDKNGVCQTSYVFNQTGNSSVVCYAVNNNTKITASACKANVLVKDKHKNQDSSGDIIVPIALGAISFVVVFVGLYKKYSHL